MLLTIVYRETKQQTLEEIAAAFGDEVVQDLDAAHATNKPAVEFVENTGDTRI